MKEGYIMEGKKHGILDKPVLSYFLLWFFTGIVSSIASAFIDTKLLVNLIPGYGVVQKIYGLEVVTADGVGVAIGAVLAIGLFYLVFKPSFDGMLKKKDFLNGLKLLAPILVLHWIGSVVSWVQYGTASVLLAFLWSLAPGVKEEVALRGLGVANYLRVNPTEKGVAVIFWLSSIAFGLLHLINILAGEDPLMGVIQAVYAVGIGMVFAAVYLRTGNLWPSILGHISLDFMEYIRADYSSSGGIMVNLGVGDWITIVAGVIAAFWGVYLIRPVKRGEIVALWKSKWSVANEE